MLSFETPKLDRIAIYLDDQGVTALIQSLQKLQQASGVFPDGHRLTDLGCSLEPLTPYGERAVPEVLLYYVARAR